MKHGMAWSETWRLGYYEFKLLQTQADFDELIENLGDRLKNAMESKSYLDPRKDAAKVNDADRKINDIKTAIRQAEIDFYKDVKKPDGSASRN